MCAVRLSGTRGKSVQPADFRDMFLMYNKGWVFGARCCGWDENCNTGGENMWRPGLAEILIVLVVVILLFGPGRISKIAKELGASISAFKEGLNGENKENKIEQAAAEEEKKEQ